MTENPLNILILGSGGREHALLQACLKSPRVASVVAAPGNGGMAREAPCFQIDPSDPRAVMDLVREQGLNFVIVGPEDPLAAGIADALEEAGITVFGPGRAGARLEASKAYCKSFFQRYGIPTATFSTCRDLESALTALDAFQFPVVVKASGLAAGKGVLICENRDQAESALRRLMEEKAFGEAGSEVVLEEFLQGEEASIMVVVSRDQYICLSPSQDHKRAGEGDTGLNTGGMGAYAPAPCVTSELQALVEREIIGPTLRGLAEEGIDYRGVLYIGLMLTAEGPKVLEYNVRFGDPECQVLLPLLEEDLVTLLWDAATGRLQSRPAALKDGACVVVVHASAGYPESYPKGEAISLPTELPEKVSIIHAGTALREGTVVTSGGRVLGVVAQAPTLEQAVADAYATSRRISWPHQYYRKDIAWRALEGTRH